MKLTNISLSAFVKPSQVPGSVLIGSGRVDHPTTRAKFQNFFIHIMLDGEMV